MAKKIIRHELVSVTIPKGSTATRFNIPDLPNLRNVHLWGLQVYTVNEVTKNIQTGNTVLSHTAVLHNSFITFVNYGGKEFLKQSPSIIYNTIAFDASNSTNARETDHKAFVGQKVNYPKSYIEFTAPPADANNDLDFLFSVYYSLPLAQEQKENDFSFFNKG